MSVARMVGGILALLLPVCVLAQGAAARVAFVGDVMLAESEGTGEWIARGGDPFIGVRALLMQSDLRVANFESSAGTQGRPDREKPFSFRTAHAALKGFGAVFDAASVANNHAGDFGRADFAETVAVLRQSGVLPFGGGNDLLEAHRAAVFERNGIRIALLGYLDFFPRWFAAAPGMPGVAWLDEDQAALDIARARAEGGDVVIVVPHWGIEHEPRANQRQRSLARALIDAGADAVIGGHPHVVQDYEIYRDKPIVYSLGNFVFDGFEDEDNVTGWLLVAEVTAKGIVALRTHGVRMDAHGSPMPDPGITGPCWKLGEARMSPCGQTERSRYPTNASINPP